MNRGAKLRPEMFRTVDAANRRTVAYARVSSHDQKDDLERQKQVLERLERGRVSAYGALQATISTRGAT